MGVTANYSWPYPAGTAAPNVPIDIKALADAADLTVDSLDDRIDSLESVSARGIIKRHRRTTPSTGSTSTTAVGVIRLDDIPLVAGRNYRITTGTVHPTSTVNTDTIRIEIRYNTAGIATTSSTVMPGAQVYEGWGNTSHIDTVFVPGSNLTISLILCVARETGTGTASLFTDSVRRTELMVIDQGVDTGATGGTNL
jgi:hypothetical protein